VAAIVNWLKKLLDTIDGDERFIMTLGSGMVNTLLVHQQIISDLIYRDIILGTVGVFILGSAYTAGVQIKQEAQVELAEATGEMPAASK
jgi:hypothetical protein